MSPINDHNGLFLFAVLLMGWSHKYRLTRSDGICPLTVNVVYGFGAPVFPWVHCLMVDVLQLEGGIPRTILAHPCMGSVVCHRSDAGLLGP